MDFTRHTATRLFLFLSLLAFGGFYSTCSAMAASEFIASKAFTEAAAADAKEAKDKKLTPGSPELNNFIGGKVGNILKTFANLWTKRTTEAEEDRQAKVAEQRKAEEDAKAAKDKEDRLAKVAEEKAAREKAEAAAKAKEAEAARKLEEERKKAAAAPAVPAVAAAAASPALQAVRTEIDTQADGLKKAADKVTAADQIITKIVNEVPVPDQEAAMTYLKTSINASEDDATDMQTVFNAKAKIKQGLTR
ncbi:MAG: hypothetical protein WCW33_05975 [Candidatus Babeliales bacterium]|jgi:hypothetical protein